MLLAAACSSATEPVATTPTSSAAATTMSAAAPTTTVAPPDANELLTTALQQYSSGYQFSATTVVNDQEATVQTGRWLDGASQITVRSGDGEVEYIITPDSQWVRLPGGEWEEVAATPAVAYPLDSMTTPNSLELVAASEGMVSVSALYAAEAVGLAGDPIEILLDFRDGTLVGVTFTTDLDGNVIESTTSFSPLDDTTPITAPTA